MVYESDFYTTRRPYTRPIVSSYSVTVRTIPYMPYIAHKRLVNIVHTPVHTYYTGTPITIRINSRVRPSILAAELQRIRDRQRPSSISYTEKYLSSKNNTDFDDEARDIRARADALLRRIHVFVPKPLPSRRFFFVYFPSTRSIYSDEGLRSDHVRSLLNTRNDIKKDLDYLNLWYQTPECRHMGDGNLACVKYVGGKPQSKRRPYYKLADLTNSEVRNDVNLLSYYRKNRQAADRALTEEPMTERELRKARANETEWSEAQKQKELEREAAHLEEIEENEPEVIQPNPIREKVKEKKEKKETKENKRIEAGAELEEEGRTKAEEEAIKRAQEFLAKRLEEARIAEEKRQAAEDERLRIEQEEEEARLALLKAQEEARLRAIAEHERLEAERRAEEERMEEARLEAERQAEEDRKAELERLRLEEEARKAAERRAAEERMYQAAVEAAAEDERERLAKELALEETNRRQEEEERLAADTNTVTAVDEIRDYDDRSEDTFAQRHLSDHEREEFPDDPTVDDDTQVI
ncbi:calponin homology domain-containing protein DDB_G0272472-like isoform X2 [Belonocnema kinseyi]|uniref:calponin homology domain-containing protein DDB_G0272472-like isoform X2 n=1 Tax=Belonocnema kinseyi TaxID=2817044 RepID=UPI00143D3A29|nr:calponin homology domain-containing protein DDB_G0272472-like isoform X2 [Belonocnema kinseyi]